MRSKVHSARAKPILPSVDHGIASAPLKSVLPMTSNTEEFGSGPEAGVNAESQTYFESLVHANTNQLISMKKEHMETKSEKIILSVQQLIDRMAFTIPENLRNTVMTCQQAYRIIVCMGYFDVKAYPKKLIEDMLKIIIARSYSIPAARILPLLSAVSRMSPVNVKSNLYDFAPRVLQVCEELSPHELSSILAIYGRHRVNEKTLTGALLQTFLNFSADLTLTDCSNVFFAMHRLESVENISAVEQLAHRTSYVLQYYLANKSTILAGDILNILQASTFFRLVYLPIYILCCQAVQQLTNIIPVSSLVDIIASLQQSMIADTDQVINIVIRIQNRMKTDENTLPRGKAVFLYANMLRSTNFQTEVCGFFANYVRTFIPFLAPLEASQSFEIIAESISKHFQSGHPCSLRLSSEINHIVDAFMRRLRAAPKDVITSTLALNTLAALMKLDYIQRYSTAKFPSLFSEPFEKRKLFVQCLINIAFYEDRPTVSPEHDSSMRIPGNEKRARTKSLINVAKHYAIREYFCIPSDSENSYIELTDGNVCQLEPKCLQTAM